MSGSYGVLGGGAFGRAIATCAARRGNDVILVTRRGDADEIPGVSVAHDTTALVDTDLVFVCVPSHAIESAADELAEALDGRHRLVHVSRGLAGDSLRTLSTVLRDRTPCRRVGALAGPLVADALARNAPGGAVVGTRFPEITAAVRDAIAGENLRVYETDDVVGVEVASACVGVLSLALGCADALAVGPSALATIATRGIAEAARVGDSFGANRATFGGLAGMGDLIAVVAGDDRPEFRIGQLVARGTSVEAATREIGSNIESITLVARLVAYAKKANVTTPIFDAVAAVLDGGRPGDALKTLMAQRVGREAA